MEADRQREIDRPTVGRLSRLELRARLAMEGYYSGIHKSPYHGFSVEFAEHREYVPGDDIKHLDWKTLAKTDRYYLEYLGRVRDGALPAKPRHVKEVVRVVDIPHLPLGISVCLYRCIAIQVIGADIQHCRRKAAKTAQCFQLETG